MMMQFQINYTNFTGTILYTKASVETIIRLLSTPAFSASSFRVKKSFPYFCLHFCHRVIIEALIWYKKIAYFCRSESLNYISSFHSTMWYIVRDKEYSGYFHGNLRFLALYLEVSATFNLRVTFIELKVLPKYSHHQ